MDRFAIGEKKILNLMEREARKREILYIRDVGYREFLDDFPESEHSLVVTKSMGALRNKLAKKLYETGVLYMKLDEFEPARMSFNQVLEQYYDTDIVENTHYEVIQSYLREGRVKKAEKHWLTKGKEYIVQEDLVNDLTLRFSENKE